MAVELTRDNFDDEVLKSSLPVLVDFWAPWCSPCQVVMPIIEQIAKEYEGKIKVGKINVDENQNLAQKYSVMSIPSFKIFRDGKVVSEFMGAQAKGKFVEEIEKALKS